MGHNLRGESLLQAEGAFPGLSSATGQYNVMVATQWF